MPQFPAKRLEQANNGGGGNRTRERFPAPPRYSYVYFIQEGFDGPIKIGIASNPEVRLTTLQTGSSRRLRLLCIVRTTKARQLERTLHEEFADASLRGEWFSPTPDLLATIAESLRWNPMPGTRLDWKYQPDDEAIRAVLERLAA